MRKWFFLALLFSIKVVSQDNQLKNLIKISDSLENSQNYSDALHLWKNNDKVIPSLRKQYSRYFTYLENKKSVSLLKELKAELLKTKQRSLTESNLLIKTYIAHYRYFEQIDSWEEALRTALEGNNLEDFEKASNQIKIEYLFDLGNIYRNCLNPYDAISFFKKSLALNIKINGRNNTDVANNYNNLGDAYVENYNPKKANECYKDAIVILERISTNKPEDTDKLLESYRNLIRSLIDYGAQDEADKYIKKVNSVFIKQKANLKSYSKELYLHSRQMQIHSNVILFAANGNFEKATAFCDSLKNETPIRKGNEDAIKFLVNRYYDVVDYMYENEQYSLCAIKINEIRPLINQFDLVYLKMLVNAKLGTIYEKLKEYEKALYHIEIAEIIVNQQNFNSSKFSIQIIKAVILSQLDRNQEAIVISKNTLEQLVYEKTNKKTSISNIKFEDVSELADTYFMNIFEKVAYLYLTEYKKTKNQEYIKIAENLYQIAGKLFQGYYLKGEFNDYLSYYHQRITEGILECTFLNSCTLEQKIKNINLIESNASQHLLKEFDKKTKVKTSVNTMFLLQISTLKTEMESYKKQKTKIKLQQEINLNRIKTLQKDIDRLEKLVDNTEKNYSKFNTTAFNTKEVLTQLSADQQLLKYYVCNTTIYVILFSNNAIVIKRVGEKELIEKEVRNYVKHTNTVQQNFTVKNNKLYAILLPFTLKKTLTIIPDGFLNYLPFESLKNSKNNSYMIKNHLISYDYSLPLWLLHQEKIAPKRSQSLAAFAPYYLNEIKNSNSSEFNDLQFAKKESKQIVALFDGTLFAEANASKANFIKEKERFNIFHLSMHSQLFEDDFNKSCLVFSGDEKLYFSELYSMNIPASMVVLSACNTGSGSLKNGEGIMSMARALTYAGVKSSVVSLWQVPDKETSEIMISFYENLKKGQAKDEALANAKNNFISKNPMKNHPFYWAGFIVNGDVSPIVSTSNNMIYIGIVLGILFLILIFVFRKKLF